MLKRIDEGSQSPDQVVLHFKIVQMRILRNRLTCNEQDQCEEEPGLPEQERPLRQATPHRIREQSQDRMTDELWIVCFCNPGKRFGELAIGINKQVLDVIVCSSYAILCGP